jgi:hypothetical protein
MTTSGPAPPIVTDGAFSCKNLQFPFISFKTRFTFLQILSKSFNFLPRFGPFQWVTQDFRE